MHKEKEILLKKPIFDKSKLKYYREEKYGYITVVSSKKPDMHETIINPTGNLILQLCDGTRCVNDVCQIMMQYYSSVPGETIIKDTLNAMAVYSGFGILNWIEGGNPFMSRFEETMDCGYQIFTAREDDINEILSFLESSCKKDTLQQKDFISYISPFKNIGMYNEIAIRKHLFSFDEEYYLLKHEGCIKGMLSISIQSDSISSAVAVGLMLLPLSALKEVFKYCKQMLSVIAVKGITKIKFHARVGDENEERIASHLSGCGFIHEGIFKKEINETDISSYALYL